MCKVFLKTWSTNAIVLILKSYDSQQLCTNMVGHTLAKLYASTYIEKINSWIHRKGLRSQGKAGVVKNFSTMDYILTLKAIIVEGQTYG